MTDFVYAADGRPHGFRLGDHIYDLEGHPVGRVWAEKVFALSGHHVGTMVNHMVVEKPSVSHRSFPPAPRPPNVSPPNGAEMRRPIGETLPDAFLKLTNWPAPELATTPANEAKSSAGP